MLREIELKILNTYIKTSNNPEMNAVIEEVLKTHESTVLSPVVVCSKAPSPTRQSILRLINEGIPFYVGAYADVIPEFEYFGCTDFIPVDPKLREMSWPIGKKRQVIVDHMKALGIQKFFMVDDDCDALGIPYKKTWMKIPLNAGLHIWQKIHEMHGLDLSAPHNSNTRSATPVMAKFGYSMMLVSTDLPEYRECTVNEDLAIIADSVLAGKKYGMVALRFYSDSPSSCWGCHSKNNTIKTVARALSLYGSNIVIAKVQKNQISCSLNEDFLNSPNPGEMVQETEYSADLEQWVREKFEGNYQYDIMDYKDWQRVQR